MKRRDVSIFGTINKVNRELVFAARYYTAARGVIVGFDGDGNLCYWWNQAVNLWSAANVIALPEEHDWTRSHHYVFSFGEHGNGCLRLYVDGMYAKFEGSLVLKNGTSATLCGNNNVKNALGAGKLVLGGCMITGGLTGSFDNSEIEVVAGTVNTSTAAFPLALDKVVVTGGC